MTKIDLESIEGPLRRRDVLLVLLESRDYTASEIVLRQMVRAMGRYAYSSDAMSADLGMLSNLGLIDLTEVAGVLFARLLEKGRDVARGDTKTPDGIAWPEVRSA